jgi:hypothetical protein
VIELATSSIFWLVFAATVLGGVAAKLVSLAIDGLLWVRAYISDLNAAVICKRRCSKR